MKKFGRYEIIAELGRGAMGVVYKARDPQIDRMVALKTIFLLGQEPEQEEEFRKRFLYEAQAAGRLQHPGIVSIFDAGEDPETHNPYIVLEYVSGESLNRILARDKKLPLPTALRLAEELADALEYAHSQGVVHRDIKPANILLNEDGHAKIADFGIAKLNLAHFTVPGRVLGTPAYMAPEQIVGEAADARSDLFSLGVILYVMVTGHAPFQGNSATTVCFKVINRDPVPASSFNLELPRALDAVITRTMAKDPGQRYQRGADLAGDLRQLQQHYKNGSTTTSLRDLSFLQVVSPARSDGRVLHDSSRFVHASVRNAWLRNLIVGAALAAIFVLAGIHMREPGPNGSRPPGTTAGSVQQSVADLHSGSNAMDAGHSNTALPSTAPRKGAPKSPSSRRAAGTIPKAVLPVKAKPPSSSLELAVQHHFKEATLSLWIDDKLTLERPLHGGVRKHLIVFNGIHGADSETVEVAAGTHSIRLRALSADQSINLSRTITTEFTGGDGKTLQVTFEKHNTSMRLAWQ